MVTYDRTRNRLEAESAYALMLLLKALPWEIDDEGSNPSSRKEGFVYPRFLDNCSSLELAGKIEIKAV